MRCESIQISINGDPRRCGRHTYRFPDRPERIQCLDGNEDRLRDVRKDVHRRQNITLRDGRREVGESSRNVPQSNDDMVHLDDGEHILRPLHRLQTRRELVEHRLHDR